MKHGKLHGIAHNFAASLACGQGFVIGYYPTNIFVEAAASEGRFLTVDFLNGAIENGIASEKLLGAISLYRDGFPAFCSKHGARISDFDTLSVNFHSGLLNNEFVVTVKDARGKKTSRRYSEYGDRIMMVDRRGRLRRTILSNDETTEENECGVNKNSTHKKATP